MSWFYAIGYYLGFDELSDANIERVIDRWSHVCSD